MNLSHPYRIRRAAKFAFGGLLLATILVAWVVILANVALFFTDQDLIPNSREDAWALVVGYVRLALLFGLPAGIFGFFSATLNETIRWVKVMGIFFIVACLGMGAYLLHLHLQSPLALHYLAMMLVVLVVGGTFGTFCLKDARTLAAKWLL